jgi:hypothetical protein
VFRFEPLSAFLHVHGLVMTQWFVLLVVQVWLVKVGRTDVHRRMGVFGGVLAAVMVGVTCVTSIRLARRNITVFPATVDWHGFLLVSFGLIFTFAEFFALAVLWRGQPGIHKRLMVLATLSIIGPAITRLPFGFIQQPSLWPSIGLSDLCMVACVVADTVRNRRLHPAFARGRTASCGVTPGAGGIEPNRCVAPDRRVAGALTALKLFGPRQLVVSGCSGA